MEDKEIITEYSSLKKIDALESGRLKNEKIAAMQSEYDVTKTATGSWGYVNQNALGINNVGFHKDYLLPMNPFDYKSGLKPSNNYGEINKGLSKSNEDFRRFLELTRPSRSTLEDIMDEIFSLVEKEQFLIDLGYRLEKAKEGNPVSDPERNLYISRLTFDDQIQFIPIPLETLFLKEVTIKFKNLLIKREVLKLKI